VSASLGQEVRLWGDVATLAGALKDKLETQKEVKQLESTRSKKRRELFDAQDQIGE